MKENQRTIIPAKLVKVFLYLIMFFAKDLSNGYAAEIPPLWQKSNGIPVLCYHGVVKSKIRDPYSISVKKFTEQMRWLHDQGYQTITLDEFYGHITKQIDLSFKKSILITFDDGRKDYLLNAIPIMEKYSFRSVNFIFPSAISRHPVMMTWKEVIQVKNRGHEIQSHTYWHPRLDQLSPLSQHFQFFVSKKVIGNRTGTKVRYLAYPFGIYNLNSKKVLLKNQYRAAFTVFPGANHPGDDPFFIHRYMVLGEHSLKKFQEMVELQQLPVYQLSPEAGSHIKRKQTITLLLPRELDITKLQVMTGKRISLKKPIHSYHYSSQTGILKIHLKNTIARYQMLILQYQEKGINYFNGFLYLSH